MTEYEGPERRKKSPETIKYVGKVIDLDAICLNCGKRWDYHNGFDCTKLSSQPRTTYEDRRRPKAGMDDLIEAARLLGRLIKDE